MVIQNPKSSRINLVSPDLAGKGTLAKVKGIARRTSFAVLGIYIIFLVGSFSASFFMGQKKVELERANAVLVKQIDELKNQEHLVQIVKNRVKLTSDIIGQSSSAPQKILEEVVSLLPAGVEIVEADAQQGKLVVSTSASSSATLAQFFDKVEAKQFAQVYLDSVFLDADGKYTVSLNIQ